MISSILQLDNEQLTLNYSASIIKSFENLVFDVSDSLFLICNGTYARH